MSNSILFRYKGFFNKCSLGTLDCCLSFNMRFSMRVKVDLLRDIGVNFEANGFTFEIFGVTFFPVQFPIIIKLKATNKSKNDGFLRLIL